MAEQTWAHHPDHPGSDTVTSLKAFTVDLAREGYVRGKADGTNPEVRDTPPAQQAGDGVTVDPAELARLQDVERQLLAGTIGGPSAQALEERETALLFREQEADAREVELDEREALLTRREEEAAGQVAAAPPVPALTEDERKARKAQAERERRARKAAGQGTTTGDGTQAAPDQEGTT